MKNYSVILIVMWTCGVVMVAQWFLTCHGPVFLVWDFLFLIFIKYCLSIPSLLLSFILEVLLSFFCMLSFVLYSIFEFWRSVSFLCTFCSVILHLLISFFQFSHPLVFPVLLTLSFYVRCSFILLLPVLFWQHPVLTSSFTSSASVVSHVMLSWPFWDCRSLLFTWWSVLILAFLVQAHSVRSGTIFSPEIWHHPRPLCSYKSPHC